MKPSIVGVGDHAEKKESERLAALSAICQLYTLDLVRVTSHLLNLFVTNPAFTVQ